jgi:hypothetical protein
MDRARSRTLRIAGVIALVAALTAFAAAVAAAEEHDWLVQALSFEGAHEGDRPFGWGGGPPQTISLDEEAPHGGRWSARIDRDSASPSGFSALTLNLPVDFVGRTVELRGFLRTRDVEGAAGLWLREDGAAGPLQFDNMQDRALTGTADWAEVRIVLPLASGARQLFFGALLTGTGTVWADDLSLLVDGKPVWEAPPAAPEETVLDRDTEFDGGSGIELGELSPVQIENLALLGRVWGFLKYHHPRIASGALHWDYELLRALPAVLAATTPPERQQALLSWVRRLGEAPACAPCAAASDHPQQAAAIDWIFDRELLGAPLSEFLAGTYERRFAGPEQFFVRQQEGVGNPIFDHEPRYERHDPPDAGYRLLALFRLWNIIEYWFPYRDLLDDDWPAVLREFIPRLAAADSAESYRLELMALIARVHDSHANLWGELALRPPSGECRLPVALRFIADRPAVAGYLHATDLHATDLHATDGPASGLAVGDVLIKLGGRPIAALIAESAPYYGASNEAALRRALAGALTRGPCGEVAVEVDRQGSRRQLTPRRLPAEGLDLEVGRTHDRPGDTFQLLSPEVAYLKLSGVRVADVASYVERAQGTRGWVIDIRNYPSEFVVFELGRRLVRQPTPFVRFTAGDLSNPGAFRWGEPLVLTPNPPAYPGKVVVLVDDATISQAEYTAMALRAGPNTTIVGSTTAGADGNVSPIPLPGGVSGLITGIGVFYPDRRPTQRVGILPDVVAAPTLAGLRDGRDEVLEAALRVILGAGADEAEIRELAAPPRPVATVGASVTEDP